MLHLNGRNIRNAVREGIGYLRLELRSVRGHPSTSYLFLRDPDHDPRLNDPTRYLNRAGSPLHRTGRGSPRASLFFFSPPSLLCHYYDFPLSSLVFVCWRSVLACSFPVQTQESDRSHHARFDTTIYIFRRDPAPKKIRARQGRRTGSPRMWRKQAQNSTPAMPRQRRWSFAKYLLYRMDKPRCKQMNNSYLYICDPSSVQGSILVASSMPSEQNKDIRTIK
jgi:hypothetical protein